MLSPPFTPQGFQSVRNIADIYYGVPRVIDKWNTKGGQNEIRYKMSGLPIVKDLMVYEDNMQRMNDYLKNRGLSWEDVKYPSLLSGAGTGGRLAYDMVAISKLYL